MHKLMIKNPIIRNISLQIGKQNSKWKKNGQNIKKDK